MTFRELLDPGDKGEKELRLLLSEGQQGMLKGSLEEGQSLLCLY